jgi:glyoxalase family protein
MLGFQVTDEMEGRTRVSVNGSGPGKSMDIVHAGDAGWAKNGVGTVHHVAMAIGTEEEQLQLRDQLVGRAQVTPVRDRQYFRSIYFREPGGVLFEVATMKPGFPVDEPIAELGRALKLPPWEEPHRTEIEAQLPNVRY